MINGASGRPIEGALVALQMPSAPGILQSQPTDAGGRYQISWLQPGWNTTAWVGAVKNNDYVQPCAATTRMDRDGTLDLLLNSVESLSAQLAQTGPAGTRSVSGVIFRATPDGRQTVEGASVMFQSWSDSPFAWTKSDWMGRYRLCGLPAGEKIDIYARQVTGIGFDPTAPAAHVTVAPGPDTVIDMELK